MTSGGDVLSELQAVLSVRREELDRMERRIAAMQEARDATLRDVAALERAIELYREYRHLPPVELGTPETIGAELRKHSPKDMIVEYAKLRGGRLKVQEAARVLAATGAFRDMRLASSHIHAAIYRNPDLFRRLGRGEYELAELQPSREESPEQPELPEQPPSEDAPASLVSFRPSVREEVLVERA